MTWEKLALGSNRLSLEGLGTGDELELEIIMNTVPASKYTSEHRLAIFSTRSVLRRTDSMRARLLQVSSLLRNTPQSLRTANRIGQEVHEIWAPED